MKKKYQIIGMVILFTSSMIYDFKKPEVIEEESEKISYVILEGEFQIVGKYEFVPPFTVAQLVEQVGTTSYANKDVLPLTEELYDEMRIYLPKVNENVVSLNHSSPSELMTLPGVGEKTAQKIIDYREQNQFLFIEDIMNVSGIGEKTYLKLRDYLCL